jgi:hypothetical protein
MSVSYQCDSCKTAISQDAIQRGEALEHQGRHFCASCKGPILAFLGSSSSPAIAPARATASSTSSATPSVAPPAPSASAAPGADRASEIEDLDPLDLLDDLAGVDLDAGDQGARPATRGKPLGSGSRPAAGSGRPFPAKPGLAGAGRAASGPPGPLSPRAPEKPAAPPLKAGPGAPAPGAPRLAAGARAPLAGAKPPVRPAKPAAAGAPAGGSSPSAPVSPKAPLGARGLGAAPRPGGAPPRPEVGPRPARPLGAPPATGAKGAPVRGAGIPRRGDPAALGARGRRAPLPSRRGRAPADLDLDAELEPKARRRVPLALVVGGSVGGVALAGVLVWAVFLRDGNAGPKPAGAGNSPSEASPSASTPGAATSVAKAPVPEPISEEKHLGWIQEFQTRLRKIFEGDGEENPDRIFELQRELMFYQRNPALSPTVKEALATLAAQIENDKLQLGRTVLERTQAKSQALQKEGRFVAAYELWKTLPQVVAVSAVESRWNEELKTAKRLADDAARWQKLVAKAQKYLGQGDKEIAIAIIEENVPADWESESEPIWTESRNLLEKLRSEAAAEIEAVLSSARKAKEDMLARQREERQKQRETAWQTEKELKPWVPLLSEGGDLENFYKTVDYNPMDRDVDPFPWKNVRVGNEQVLSADTTGRDAEVLIGMIGNRWLDWVLEFKVQVLDGTLRLETRTEVEGMMGNPGFKNRPSEPIALEAKDYGDWKQITVEVFGSTVRFLEEGQLKKEIKIDIGHERGGFQFILAGKSSCQIKGLNLKLVNELRPGEEGTSRHRDEDDDEEEW